MKHGWDYKKLGELVQVLNGYAFKSSLYENQGIRVLRITNVQKGNIVDDDPKYYPLSLTDEIRNYLLKENDLLMSLTGNVGRVGLLTKEMLPAALNQRVACLRILSNGLNLGFLFHYLNSDKFEQDAVLSAKGIAQKNMSTEWLKDYKLPLPPISVQQTIVSELDKINELIRLKKEQLKDYDNLAQSIFYEMFGDPVVNEKGWGIKKLGNFCEIGTGSTPSRKNKEYYEGSISWVKSTEVSNCVIDSTEEHISEIAIAETNCTIYPKGTILIAMYGQGKTRGQIAILNIEATTNQAVAAILPSELCDKLFLYHCLHLMYENIRSMARGGNQANLNLAIVRSINIILPPLPLQQAFAQRIELIEQQKAEIQSTIADLETLLASRMQYWFDL